jgi:hypothetical protein
MSTHFIRPRTNFLILLGLLLCLTLPAGAQVPDHTQRFNPDSLRIKKDTALYTPPKRFGRAIFELGLAEIIPWVFDRYVKKADYAYINYGTMVRNLGNWQWDNDPFPTNQIAHPFHGSIFYNSFRSNGYNFWESMPAAFVGSYIWETFAENQAPAPNDFINTGFAGVMLGEVTHRIAEKIHNSHRRGFWKTSGEIFATLINPMDGFNRALDGTWGKTPAWAKRGHLPAIQLDFDLGARRFNANSNDPISDGKFGFFGRAKLNYGTLGKDYKTPFSNFTFVTEFGSDDTAALNILSLQASVTGWKLNMARNTHLALLTANYDYIRNDAFFYSAESIKMNLFSEYALPKNSTLNTFFGVGPILLSAIPDPYRKYEDRNYDYGSGVTVSAGGLLNINNRLSLNVKYTRSWTYTLNGSESSYRLSTFTTEASLRVAKDIAISAEAGYFKLLGNYRIFDDTIDKYPYLRLSGRYSLSL